MSWMAAATLASAGLNYFGQKSANQTNARIASDASQTSQANAREQMAFQERMSNTAYQRGFADMKAAGINPILAGKTPASSPGGAMGQVFTYQHQNVARAAIDGYQIASQSQAQQASAKQSTAQAALTKTQQRKVRTEIQNKIPAEVQKLKQQGMLAQAQISVAEAEARLKDIALVLTQMDQKALQKMGLSPMQLKHAPMNQIGSLIIDKMITLYGKDPKAWKMSTQEIITMLGAGS